jgi:hypothetical protein
MAHQKHSPIIPKMVQLQHLFGETDETRSDSNGKSLCNLYHGKAQLVRARRSIDEGNYVGLDRKMDISRLFSSELKNPVKIP